MARVTQQKGLDQALRRATRESGLTCSPESASGWSNSPCPLANFHLAVALHPAHSTQWSLIGWLATGSHCHWPGVHGGGHRETYLSAPPEERYCARRWRLKRLCGEKRPARRRANVGTLGPGARSRERAAVGRVGGFAVAARFSEGRSRTRRSAAREPRAVETGLAERRRRGRWGSELAAKTPAKGEKGRTCSRFLRGPRVKWERCPPPRRAVPRGSRAAEGHRRTGFSSAK